jgi:hypothetical protein
MGAAPALPFGKSDALDINHYVVLKSLDGLFFVLAMAVYRQESAFRPACHEKGE